MQLRPVSNNKNHTQLGSALPFSNCYGDSDTPAFLLGDVGEDGGMGQAFLQVISLTI